MLCLWWLGAKTQVQYSEALLQRSFQLVFCLPAFLASLSLLGAKS